MKVYRFTENDYETVCSWWKKQDWPVVPYENLSVDGMIVKDNKNSIAAGWLFKTNSPVYILEWIVGNPEVEMDQRFGRQGSMKKKSVDVRADNQALLDFFERGGKIEDADPALFNVSSRGYKKGGSRRIAEGYKQQVLRDFEQNLRNKGYYDTLGQSPTNSDDPNLVSGGFFNVR